MHILQSPLEYFAWLSELLYQVSEEILHVLRVNQQRPQRDDSLI